MLLQNFIFFLSILFFRFLHRPLLYDEFIRLPISDKVFSFIFCALYSFDTVTSLFIYTMDYRNLGIALCFTGMMLNLVILLANKGRMPVDKSAHSRALAIMGEHEADRNICDSRRHTLMNDTTKLNFLGDRFGRGVSSIGDYLMRIGSYIWLYTAILHLLYRMVILLFN